MNLGGINVSIGGTTSALAAALDQSLVMTGSSVDKIQGMMSGMSQSFEDNFTTLFEGISGVDTSIVRTIPGFNKLHGVASKTFGMMLSKLPKVNSLITKLSGPIGLVLGALAGGAAYIALNFEKSVHWITKFINKIIDWRNEYKAVRILVDSVVAAFKNLFDVGGAIVSQFSIVFNTLKDGVKALISGDFTRIGEVFTKGLKDSMNNAKKLGKDLLQNQIDTVEQFGKKMKPVREEDVARVMAPFQIAGNILKKFLDPDGIVGEPPSVKKALFKIEDSTRGEVNIPGIPSGTDIKKAADKYNKKLVEALEPVRKNIEKAANKSYEAWNKTFNEKMGASIIKVQAQLNTFKNHLNDFRSSFADTFGGGAADIITNLFQGANTEKLRELNRELRETQNILSDQKSTNAQKEAAKQRVALIKAEIKAEKQRGNVILQTAKLAIDSAKSVIKSMLAKAIAGAIAGESSKGLLGLITAGVAIAGITALFASKVPKLARGGQSQGPALVMIGDNASGKEMVHPWERNDEFAADISKHLNLQNGTASGGNIYAETKVGVEDIILLVHNGLPGFIRKHGYNPFSII